MIESVPFNLDEQASGLDLGFSNSQWQRDGERTFYNANIVAYQEVCQ